MKFIKKLKEIVADIHINGKMSHGLKILILLNCLMYCLKQSTDLYTTSIKMLMAFYTELGKQLQSHMDSKDIEFTK